ncbi:MAG: EAL domain-containing protein [Methylococcales bacterium]|nr:EAL domain-containing protein [Methylococcales bacterium]
MGISIGITIVNDGRLSPPKVLSRADAACYAAKDAGRNRIVKWQESDGDESTSSNVQISQASIIEDNLNNNQYTLHFQPIQPMYKKSAVMWEVLVRMRTEGSDELLLPGSFLPTAGRCNLMQKIDCWVFSRLCKLLKDNDAKKHGEDLPVLSVNISAESMAGQQQIDFYLDEIKATGVPNNRFCFEIAETTAISALQQTKQFIETMRSAGCLCSLDDFGSGMGSFNHLRQLPINFIKIDGGIIKDIKKDLLNLTIVEFVHQVGQAIDVKTIANYVETEGVQKKLLAIGIDYMQGYHFSQPLSTREWIDQVGFRSH